MGMLELKDVYPGMTLGDDIKTIEGTIILPKGHTLQEKEIKMLQKLGINKVNIQGVKGGKNTKIKIKRSELDRLENYLTPFFAANDFSDPLVRNLYHLSLTKLAQKYVQGWEIPDLIANLPIDDGSLTDKLPLEEVDFVKLVQAETSLTSFPDIYFKIIEAINSPQSSAEYLAEIVSKDPSLAAKLLKLANSSFYGTSQPVETVSRAITIIGTKELAMLALGISAINVFKDIPPELIDMRAFWLHSLGVGILAKLLAQRSSLSPEKYFVAGLLHDIGRLIIFKHLPRLSTKILLFSYSNLLPLVEAEKEILGFDHALVGNGLIQSWKLPPSLGKAIKLHHFPGQFTTIEDAIIHLADFLAIGIHLTEKGSLVLPILNKSIHQVIQLSPAELTSLINRALLEIEDTLHILF